MIDPTFLESRPSFTPERVEELKSKFLGWSRGRTPKMLEEWKVEYFADYHSPVWTNTYAVLDFLEAWDDSE